MFTLIFKIQKLIRKTIGQRKVFMEHPDAPNGGEYWTFDRINLIKYAYRYFSKMHIKGYSIELMPYGEVMIKSDNCGYMGFRTFKEIEGYLK